MLINRIKMLKKLYKLGRSWKYWSFNIWMFWNKKYGEKDWENLSWKHLLSVALLAYEFIITNTTNIFNNISSLGYKIYIYIYIIKCRLQNKFQMKMHFYLLWNHLYYYYFITKIAKSGNQIQLGNEIQLKKILKTLADQIWFFFSFFFTFKSIHIYSYIRLFTL